MNHVNAAGSSCGDNQTFSLIRRSLGRLRDGDTVWIQVPHDKYLTAHPKGHNESKAAWRRSWETFTIEKVNLSNNSPAGRRIRYGDKVAFKSRHGKYLVAENGGGHHLNVNRPRRSIWETFTLVEP